MNSSFHNNLITLKKDPSINFKDYQRINVSNCLSRFKEQSADEGSKNDLEDQQIIPKYKRLITQEYNLTVKCQSVRPNIFAVGTIKGNLLFGNTQREASNTIHDQIYFQEFIQQYYPNLGMNKIVKERISPQLLKPESTLRVVENPIFDLLWLNNDRQILTACGHKYCHLIDAETNFNIFTLDHHDSAVKSLAKCDENNLVASGGRDGKIFLYDFRMRDSGAVGAFNLIGRHFFSQQILQKGGIGVSGQSSSRKPSGNLVSLSVTGLAFYGQTQLVSIESHSDKISFFDLKMLDSSDVRNVRQATSPVQNSMNQTPRKLQNFSKMFQCALENTFYQSTFGDPYKTQKGNISIVIKGNKMLVNSMDSVISLYDMYNIYQKPPQRFIGHKSMHEFYVRANFGFYDDFIVSGSEDEKVHIWDVKAHQEIAHLGCSEQNFGHIGISNEVQWCEHDKIISTSDDLSVIVWDVLG